MWPVVFTRFLGTICWTFQKDFKRKVLITLLMCSSKKIVFKQKYMFLNLKLLYNTADITSFNPSTTAAESSSTQMLVSEIIESWTSEGINLTCVHFKVVYSCLCLSWKIQLFKLKNNVRKNGFLGLCVDFDNTIYWCYLPGDERKIIPITRLKKQLLKKQNTLIKISNWKDVW